MLNLKEFKTMNKQVNDYYYLFNIEAKDKPTVCLMCNAVDVEFKKHSNRERELSDVPIHGKPVKLMLNHKIYRFTISGKDDTD